MEPSSIEEISRRIFLLKAAGMPEEEIGVTIECEYPDLPDGVFELALLDAAEMWVRHLES
jgi:hypothetical protein